MSNVPSPSHHTLCPQSHKADSEDGSFEALEKEFQEVLSELLGDKSLEKFRVEYEKLTNALKKSHESEKRLMTKCRELNAEIVSNSAKVATALKLSQEDQTTITSLKKVRPSSPLSIVLKRSEMGRLKSQFHIRTFILVGNISQHTVSVGYQHH